MKSVEEAALDFCESHHELPSEYKAFLAGDANGFARAIKEATTYLRSFYGWAANDYQHRDVIAHLENLLPDWATSQQKEGE